MPLSQKLRNFDITNSTVQVWLFKKSVTPEKDVRFTGRWIHADEHLDQALKEAAIQKRDYITEVGQYGLLASTNDGIALHINTLETRADAIIAETATPAQSRKIKNIKDVQNTKFYVIKFVCDDHVLLGVRKTDDSWQSKRAHNRMSVFFSDSQLGLNQNPEFNISRDFDFFIVDDDVVIMNKSAFESVLNYKTAHAQDFVNLQSDEKFSLLFTTLSPLIEFVGTNKLHLRRACAIHQKGHYRDESFMTRLRQRHGECGLNLTFDSQGRIVPTPETCADIMRALLDHRLSSIFSMSNYDVSDAMIVR